MEILTAISYLVIGGVLGFELKRAVDHTQFPSALMYLLAFLAICVHLANSLALDRGLWIDGEQLFSLFAFGSGAVGLCNWLWAKTIQSA